MTDFRRPNVSYAYPYQGGLYLNITPRCPTACQFCIKFSWDWLYRGHNLKLTHEPSVEEIVDAAENVSSYREIIFCGYGESTYRLEAMREIANALKSKGAKQFRLNTIGLGNLIHNRNIAPDLAQFIQTVSVSLNTLDPKHWVEIHRPQPQFKENGYLGVLDFIRACTKVIPETFVTAVESDSLQPNVFEKFVRGLGATPRLRPKLDEYEAS